MSKYAVVGASLMGRTIAKDLLLSETDARVTLLDLDVELLEEVTGLLAQHPGIGARLTTGRIDVRDLDRTAAALAGHDAVVGALPHACALYGLEAAVLAGVPMVDLVGSKPVLRRELDSSAREAGVLIVPGLGVAPGLSNVLVARGVEMLDEAHEAVIYVGGIPMERTPPLEYQTVYSLVSMFGVFLRPVRVWRNGAWTSVEPLSGLEHLEFPEPIGTLEACYTDGLGSLVVTMTGRIRDSLEEKTLRYPGFADKVRFLKECGLLDPEPLKVGDVEVAPRDVLIRQLAPRLTLGPKGDILVMRVVVKGESSGGVCTHTFDLVDFMDPESGDTAMARTTGFPATIAARMMAGGTIAGKGVRFPEELFVGDLANRLARQLEERGVSVAHDVR
jgi:lysine 6-dehydrogenase